MPLYYLMLEHFNINKLKRIYIQHKCKDVGVNIEDEELVKIFNPTWKRRETILFFLIVVINELK